MLLHHLHCKNYDDLVISNYIMPFSKMKNLSGKCDYFETRPIILILTIKEYQGPGSPDCFKQLDSVTKGMKQWFSDMRPREHRRIIPGGREANR